MKYILIGLACLVLLCLQAFFYPLIYNWYITTYFGGNAFNSGLLMQAVMILTAFGVFGGVMYCTARAIDKEG